ncbi:MAG: putative rane protein [Myxococcales bacterium]|nr:putative rane protein [Myxococcales bacterium]
MNGLPFRRLMVGLLFGAIVLTACLMPAQSDTYWHLRAGQDFWRTHAVPVVESYSHTAAGAFWPNHEWLWQAASFALFRAGGFPLLTLAGAALVTLAFALVYRLMVGPTATRFVLMALAMPLSASVWALRPQIASLALLAILLTLIVRERYLWLPPLFALWANVHGAVALGGVVLGAVALAALWKARRPDADDPRARARAVTLVVTLPVCAFATTLTPLRFKLWSFIFESMGRSREIGIDEWRPAYPTKPLEVGFWLLALAFVAMLVWRRHARADWPTLALAAAALATLPLAARAGRNIAPFLVVVIPAASRRLGESFTLARKARLAAADVDRPRFNLAFLIVFAVLGVSTVGTAWATALPHLGWRPVSAGAIAAVRACPGPLYNLYGDGGLLIWLAPGRPVFLDSRQDPYPRGFVREALSIEAEGDFATMFARYGIRCAFLPLTSPTLPRLRAAGWPTRFADDRWAVLAAPDSP